MAVNTNMFEQNQSNLLNDERVILTGMAGADNELRLHAFDMGTLIGDHPVVALSDIHVRFHGDN